MQIAKTGLPFFGTHLWRDSLQSSHSISNINYNEMSLIYSCYLRCTSMSFMQNFQDYFSVKMAVVVLYISFAWYKFEMTFRNDLVLRSVASIISMFFHRACLNWVLWYLVSWHHFYVDMYVCVALCVHPQSH